MFTSYIKTSLIALTAIASVNIAHADDDFIIFENVANIQENVSDVFSTVNMDSDTLEGEGQVDGSAFGNTFVLSSDQDQAGSVVFVGGQQSETNSVNADMVLNVDHAQNITLNNEATVNKSVLVSQGIGHNTVSNVQNSFGDESISNVNFTSSSASNVAIASTSGGNFGQYVLEGRANTINTSQTNNAMQASNVKVNVGSVSGGINVNSRAWGNSNVIVLGKAPTN